MTKCLQKMIFLGFTGVFMLGVLWAGQAYDGMEVKTSWVESPSIADSDPVWPDGPQPEDDDPVWPDTRSITDSDPVWPDSPQLPL